MKLTPKERVEIENLRRAVYVVVKGIDAGILHVPRSGNARPSQGELDLISKACTDLGTLFVALAIRLENGVRLQPQGADMLMVVAFTKRHPKADFRALSGLLEILVSRGSLDRGSEEALRHFLQEFHEFLHAEVLRKDLPEERATSLEAAHG